MTLDRKVRMIAGTSPYWFLFTAFVGANLFQSSLTKWCLMEDILRKTGIHREGGS